jgi:hypothetical protein
MYDLRFTMYDLKNISMSYFMKIGTPTTENFYIIKKLYIVHRTL